MNDFIITAKKIGDSYIISPNFFEKQKTLILTEIQFCDRNENESKKVIQKFHEFTYKKF